MSATHKLVLISLADQSNDEGLCWPSVRSIRQRTCLSERAIQDALAKLEASGALRRMFRSGHSTHYIITPAVHAPPQQAHPRTERTTPPRQMRPSPAGGAPPPPQHLHPESSVEPSLNRQRNKKPLRSARKTVDNSVLAAAWIELRQHISNNTRPEDELLREAALKLGGLDRLGAMSTWDLDKRRQDFETAYKMVCQA